MGGCVVMRKGAWTQQEDDLLRDCVQANGEGNWHQVPAKAGLNRCRKSCRLRWLNYLKPNLKRGKFEEDEVDLLIKLHNLLGNRWSMIAKRLPGRTGNGVKNYWNTHLAKKFSRRQVATKNKPASCNVVRVQVIRPKPRTLKNILSWQQHPTIMKPTISPTSSSSAAIPSLINTNIPPAENEEISSWWETLLAEDNNNNNDPIGGGSCVISQENTNNAKDSSSLEDSLWAMLLSDEDHIHQSIWEKLSIIDHTPALAKPDTDS